MNPVKVFLVIWLVCSLGMGGCMAASWATDHNHHSAIRTAVGEVKVGMSSKQALQIAGLPDHEDIVGDYVLWTYEDDIYTYFITLKYGVVTKVETSTD